MRRKRIKPSYAIHGGTVNVNGEDVPLYMPVGKPHYMDFDRIICAAGVERFLRPRLPSDDEPRPIGDDCTHIQVCQVEPGVRIRIPVDFQAQAKSGTYAAFDIAK